MANDRNDGMPATPKGATVMESLRRELEGLGLPPYQARVLAALLQVGTANSNELARMSGIPRTSTYPVMEALVAQDLVERLPTLGPAEWTCRSWKTVVKALEADGYERMREYEAQLGRLRKILAAVSTKEAARGSVTVT